MGAGWGHIQSKNLINNWKDDGQRKSRGTSGHNSRQNNIFHNLWDNNSHWHSAHFFIFFRCVNMVHVYAITAKTQRCFSSIALMCVEYVCLGVKPVHCHYHFVSNTHGRVWLLMKNCLGIPYDQTQSHLSQQEMSVSPHRRDSSLMMPSRPVLCCSPAASLLF